MENIRVSAFLLVYRMLIVAPKYGGNEQKMAKNPIFSSLKAL